MWQTVSRAWRAAQAIPTTDLYFGNAMRSSIRLRPGSPKRSILRVGANSFVCGKQAVVCRRDDERVVAALLARDDLRLTYVIDDDLDGAEADETLPDDYRRQLARLREGQYAALIERAETVVVPAEVLAAKYAERKETALLDPHWSEAFADERHFAALESNAPIDIAYLGSVTHGADRAFVFEVMARLLGRNPRLRLTLVSAAPLGNALDRHPRVRRLRPLPWFLYRRRLARQRFHLALYPMLDTPFNRGRSLNKLIEHAVVGAVGVYSADWAFADRVRHGETGFLAENAVANWADTIEAALADPGRLRAMQRQARSLAARLNAPEPQRAFWRRQLGLES